MTYFLRLFVNLLPSKERFMMGHTSGIRNKKMTIEEFAHSCRKVRHVDSLHFCESRIVERLTCLHKLLFLCLGEAAL